MKKFSVALALMLVLIMTLSVVVSAGPEGIIENPEITVPYMSPSIDGNIDANEGWSTAALMNAETLGYYWAHNPLSSDGNVFFAVDEDGLYVAGRFVEGLTCIDPRDGTDLTGLNQYNYCTGEDTLDLAEDGANQYGWNGDVFGLMLDPLGALIYEGFTANDYSAWYMVGLFDDGSVRVYKTHSSTDGEITDKVVAAGKKEGNGWCFEMRLPWDIIIKDTFDASMGYVDLKAEDLFKAGATMRVGAMYHDRFYDEEQGAVQTWGRYITAPTTLPDGTPGNMGTGEHISSYGINVKFADDVPGFVEGGNGTTDSGNNGNGGTTDSGNNGNGGTTDSGNNGTTDSGNNGNGGTTDSGNKGTSTSGNKGTGSTSQNKGTSTNTNAAQTLDMTVVIALGALATSGLGVAVCKKRR